MKFQKSGSGIVLLLLLAVVMFSGCQPLLVPVPPMIAEVKTHASRGDVQVVADATARLVTNDTGAMMSFDTSELIPGHVYTAWWVVINNPAACGTEICTPQDVLGNTAEVQAEITYADGYIAGASGQGKFAAYLASGDVPNPWFGNGFTNPLGATIHMVINDHGPVIPELVDDMLTGYRAGCTDDSLPPPFPDTAKADGTPGPNTCQLFQFADFGPQ